MKIPRQLPKFEGENCLAIVSGKQDARLYLVGNGNIDQIKLIKIEKPKYSDRESFFKTRTSGKTIRSGSVFETKKEVVVDPFLHELRRELLNISRNRRLSRLFMFYPSYLKNQIFDCVPKELAKKIEVSVNGDYKKYHPFKLLEKINQDVFERKKITPTKANAKKILDKPRYIK